MPVNVPISSVTPNLTVHVRVTGVKTWRVRLWLAMRLIRLAARVAGVGLRIED